MFLVNARCWLLFCFTLRACDFSGASAQWPRGEYGLLKPTTGCPKQWKSNGWIFQDTYDGNNRSEVLHINGYVARNYVTKSLCINTDNLASTTDQYWPEGKYCIYRNTEKKSKLENGSILMYGEQDGNKDATRYTTFFAKVEKKGWHKTYTEFYFSCQTRGNKKNPISLPITKPFYLLPYGSRDCQQVKWMVATSEWIKYHTRDYKVNSKELHYKKGKVPHHKLENGGIKMYYCYYKSCNYTLTDKKGVFQSPGFPGKYPDGQLCSWRIMVPDNHTLHVHFTHFSLSSNDTLRFSKSITGSFRSLYAFHAPTLPFTLPFTSDVRFVFHSDESKTNTGFRAEYRVFIPQAKPKPTETTVAPATPSVTSSITLTTPRSDLIEETTKTTLPMSKTQDTRTTAGTSKSKSTVTTKARVSTKPQQTKPVNESLTPTNCTTSRAKNALTNSRDWHGKLVVIVIPLACFLVVVFVIVDIVYRCRSKRKNSTNRGNEVRSVEQLPLVVNPTYDRGAILLNQPNDTTTLTTMMEVNENGTGMNQPRTDKPPDYEDIESWKPNKIPECNGSNVHGVTRGGPTDIATTEETSNLSENPFYESASTSPPLVEANKLYESIKIDKEKAK